MWLKYWMINFYLILCSSLYSQEIDYSKVIELSNEHLKNDSLNVDYLKARAEAYSGINDYEKALHDYSKIIKLTEKDWQVYYNIGTIMYFINKLDSAIFYYNKSIKIENNAYDSYYGRGVANLKIGKYLESISDYKFFLNNVNYEISNKLKSDILNDIGLSYFYLKDYKKSIDSYTSAIEYNESVNVYYNIALAKVKTLNYNDALIDINKSLALDSTNQYANEVMALIQFKLGNYENACIYLKKYSTLTGFIKSELDEIICK
ncbi:MAG: hypothetical protein A2033_14765 [Bacteroidetes bacterium GWA2_31_9]|nr:MAG: hypothetical protein A2033_14765 [Bacteroidetes bacterium GWA2_31_9]